MILLLWVEITGFYLLLYLVVFRFKIVVLILLKHTPEASFVFQFEVDHFSLLESLCNSILMSKSKHFTGQYCKFESYISLFFYSVCESHVSL